MKPLRCPDCGTEHVSFTPPDPLVICLDCGASWTAERGEVLARVCQGCGRAG